LVLGFVTASGLLAAASLTAVAADEKKPEPPVARQSKGPALTETGRVGAPNVETGGTAVEPRSTVTIPSENSVERAVAAEGEAEDDSARKATPGGVIDPVRLDQEVKARFSEARTCRIDVARRKQVGLAKVMVKTLELRWTILPTGAVTATQVVATSPADPEIMSCVKARMASWTFTRPEGGPVAVDRSFWFR
jgi:hypothetical protein